MSNTFSNKSALITGATSGIGLQCAHILAQKKYDLVLIGRTESKMQKALQELEKYHVQLYPLILDLSVNNAAEIVIDYCHENKLFINVLICNAGTYLINKLTQTSPEKAKILMNLHILNPTLLCRYFGGQMKDQQTGHILIVSSLAAYTPYPTFSFYASSKRYLHSFSKALGAELRPYKVYVTNLCPGGVDTDFFPGEKGNIIKIATCLHLMMSAHQVAKQGLDAMFKRKAKITPGLVYRILIAFIPLIPSGLIVLLHKRTSMFS